MGGLIKPHLAAPAAKSCGALDDARSQANPGMDMPSRPILSPFLKFADEAAIIGRLSAGYTTLEVGLMNCVQVVRDDFDAVLKAMFRVRSETGRIDVADALGRHFYDDRLLRTEFEMAIGAVRHCLKIRNQ